MTLNYFKIAWRNITHNKGFASINVVGLTLGLTCAIMIFSLINYHLSFDNFHGDLSRTYRVVAEYRAEGVEKWEWTPQPLGKAFMNDFDFAEKVARARSYRTVIVSLPEEEGNKKFEESWNFEFVEPALFEIFNFELVAGKASALGEPNTAIITQQIARKYFGTEDVLDKLIRVDSYGKRVDFRIVGLLKDMPNNTAFTRQILVSYQNLKDYNEYYASDRSWGSFNSGMQCFVKLRPGVTKEQVDAAMPALVNKYYDGVDEKNYAFMLQPMSEVHFDTDYGAKFSYRNLWTLSIAGFFLLLIACINFINLATAQVLNRSKEVGIRKILGSHRSYIFIQFIVETGIIAVFSLIIACMTSQLMLPLLNSVMKEKLTINFMEQWQLSAFLAGILIFVVFASGIYPAVLLTRFQPARVLKEKFSGGSGFSLRKVLIVAQFVVSQVLIISMIVIYAQMKYSVDADMGFDRDALIMVPIPTFDKTRINTMFDRVSQLPGVHQVSRCFESPGSDSNALTGARFGEHTEDEVWEVNLKDADENYLPTFNLKLVAGRNLLPADTVREFLVNETFVKKLGVASPEEVIGKPLAVNGGTMRGTIEGVVKDFYTYSFHEAIGPICIAINYERFRHLAVKVDMSESQNIITKISAMWNETYPDHIFSYQFLDEKLAKFYEADNAILKLVEIAALIAIIISCLGLYGLVSFMAVRKTKEIGVRKVLGASVPSILWLFGKEFAILIVVAFVAAAPLAWLAMDRWLQAFVYKIDISPLSFVLSITFTMVVAAITVSYHSLRSALANPARSLRSE